MKSVIEEKSIFGDLQESLQQAIEIHQGKNEPSRVTKYTLADVKALRAKLHISRRELAEAIDVSPETVKSWELGRRNPTGLTNKVLKLIEEDPKVFSQLSAC